MFQADAAAAGWHDLGLAGQKLPQELCVFEINVIDVFFAEIALFFHANVIKIYEHSMRSKFYFHIEHPAPFLSKFLDNL